jgi:hypothetical protein
MPTQQQIMLLDLPVEILEAIAKQVCFPWINLVELERLIQADRGEEGFEATMRGFKLPLSDCCSNLI